MTEPLLCQKYTDELQWWKDAIVNITDWYMGHSPCVWRHPSPSPPGTEPDFQKAMIALQKAQSRHYPKTLQLSTEGFYGRLLEIGAGPLCPSTVFASSVTVAVDPLMLEYAKAGFPISHYPAVCLNARTEDLETLLPDGMFDTIVSHDAIDHMDSFIEVAKQVKRLAAPGAVVRLNITYRKPTVTEPLEITDSDVLLAFSDRPLTRMAENPICDYILVLWGTDSWSLPVTNTQ